MATATHATRPRTNQRPRRVVAGVETPGLIVPTSRFCSLVPSVTTLLYSTLVFDASRGSFSEQRRTKSLTVYALKQKRYTLVPVKPGSDLLAARNDIEGRLGSATQHHEHSACSHH